MRKCTACGLTPWQAVKQGFTLRVKCVAGKPHRFQVVAA